MSSMRPAVFLPFVFALAACSSSPPPAPKEPPKASANAKQAAPAEEVPPGSVSRRSVDNVLLRGPGWMLARIQPEEVIRQNKFVGWRLVAFPSDWDKTGLQPGDIVTEVNGISVEKPEDLWNAYLALSQATELRIGIERDGKPAMTVVPIHGAPAPETKVALESGTAMPSAPEPAEKRPAKKGTRRKDTVVITDESAGDADDASSMYY